MLSILFNRVYRHLFVAQLVALVGTGLLTVALGLLAFDLAGRDAGRVLGMALAIKMVAYITVAPIVGAYATRFPRKAFLVLMDLARGGVALCLPFVSEIWQIYVLIFLLQSASAAFTPVFQASIPEILPDDEDYTNALALSRLAYDMESLASPAIAAALLSVVSFTALFAGTALGFLVSALLVTSSGLSIARSGLSGGRGILRRISRGTIMYLKTPRLVGLLAITVSASAAGAMVIVNTVVVVRENFGLSQTEYAITLAAYGFGSMLVAFGLPTLLKRFNDRTILLAASCCLTVLLCSLGVMEWTSTISWRMILIAWFLLGAGYALCVTPAGRLLKRSSHSDNRAELFSAQFALSHACWLIAYPVAGWIGSVFGMAAAFQGLGLLSALGMATAIIIWPRHDVSVLLHDHPELSPDHPHLQDGHRSGEPVHAFVIDDLHTHWPRTH
ncbi:MFS transporter [Hyphomonas sp.]|uniref:MFS transporter n=1 Tax=Hyphomonas sp. TaxID=87 RepID=UPI0025C178EB|nr:MFS transporter [Hyphomonas sp.]